jgi:tripartite-type tricarboxylate transporter receptor subunit TctC
MRAALRAALLGLAMVVAAIPVAAADYYAGKKLTVLINYAVGGPADIEGRVVAHHLGRVLAGTPIVVVQNMDGAGGVVGTNYLGEIAPKDGTVLGLLTGAAWTYVGKPETRRVDFKTYEFVAFQPGTSIYFMRTDTKPGIKSPVDLGRAEGVISGGLGADNSKDMLLRIALDMLGIKHKYVTGYRGSAAARLALQQGEINYFSESPPSYRSVIEPSLVKSGEVIGLFFDPAYDGREFKRPRQVEGMDLTSFPELYEKIKGAPPSGQLWEAYKAIISLNGAMQRMAVLPPGAPREAIDALRAAFQKLNSDTLFAEECRKTFGYSPEFYAGADTSERVRGALSTTPEMKSFLEQYIKKGSPS